MHLCKKQVNPVEEYQNITLTGDGLNAICDVHKKKDENVTAWLESELVFFEATVHHIGYHTKRTSPCDMFQLPFWKSLVKKNFNNIFV